VNLGFGEGQMEELERRGFVASPLNLWRHAMLFGRDCSQPSAMTGRGFVGPLDLRAPEDQFSSDEQVETRHRRPLQAPELDGTIAAFMHAWSAGDEDGTRIAAKELVDGTHAHFQAQGVPAFAHPIVPPQFPRAIAETVRRLPGHYQANALRSVLDAFEGHARAGVEREISLALTASGEAPDESEGAVHRKRDAQASGCGCDCSSCAGKKGVIDDYGWK
jgi:hypothetical protein